ncbi:hypothetical protein HNP00_004499 [Arthrobacter sp. AZCC_0090]|nr:hypothetical protein [Arthrobacter sp. AZCC_0090]
MNEKRGTNIVQTKEGSPGRTVGLQRLSPVGSYDVEFCSDPN